MVADFMTADFPKVDVRAIDSPDRPCDDAIAALGRSKALDKPIHHYSQTVEISAKGSERDKERPALRCDSGMGIYDER